MKSTYNLPRLRLCTSFSALLLLLLLQCVQQYTANALSASDCASSKCKIQLSNDLQLHYRIHLSDEYNDDASTECKSCKIEVQLLYDGFTWLGIGLSNDGGMEGSHAIIGQPGIADPISYYLKEMDINALERTNVKMTNKNIDFIDGRTIMDFTVHFADWGALVDKGACISLLSPTTFIWAHGNDGEEQLQYHGPNNKKSYTVDDLLVSTEHSDLFKTKSVQQNQNNNSGAWKAHGILAFVAWGVFAPFAITTAILRDIEVPSRFKELAASKLHLLSKLKENWLRIHIVLNSFVCVMTMLVFIIAVVNVNKESGMHWYYAHSKMGLAMFILSCNQVLGGYLRPSKDTTQEENGEESSNGEAGNSNGEENGISNENGEEEDADEERKVFPMKSFGRQAWELLHHILGLALFLFATWQMFEGIELYHMKYGTSGGAAAVILGLYILWIAVWLCIIIGGTVYKWYMQTRRLAHHNSDDDDKKIEGDACSDLEMKEIS